MSFILGLGQENGTNLNGLSQSETGLGIEPGSITTKIHAWKTQGSVRKRGVYTPLLSESLTILPNCR